MAADTPTSVPHQRISADITDLKRRTTILERVRVYGTGGDGSGGGGGVTDHGDLTGLGDDDRPASTYDQWKCSPVPTSR